MSRISHRWRFVLLTAKTFARRANFKAAAMADLLMG